MKKSMKLLSLLFVVLFAVSACSKDDDPADNDIFVDEYRGTISYVNKNDSEKNVAPTQGKVTVTKVGGSNYSFIFDSDIPDILNVKMQKGDNNKLFLEDGKLGLISIDADQLTIGYSSTDEGETWTANCKRD
ncbi:hypothetical protein SMI01S_19990 [Sphingobacterium mizutaii NBRC 14946 = DSM 11724]|uniref:Uncharacterized protein n=2 Tax=Sphingobacterium mizutaii TaxID=1010 RepID=A0AAJ4XBJ4_9SPHI|nr:hypothetical protein [Sphingobacterium mizutaii]GEM68393.1 hypothetical protein SMI01S_19990 [Sphingobacterium mizutaii NBRC 14946 = DSM 11724]SDL06959.1 hypothetical protein SAMN05192578_1011126 [Sphingobacterium mizutaii]SNV51009.1 Uncharacterised protein [Sphingobacterium mizutaii]